MCGLQAVTCMYRCIDWILFLIIIIDSLTIINTFSWCYYCAFVWPQIYQIRIMSYPLKIMGTFENSIIGILLIRFWPVIIIPIKLIIIKLREELGMYWSWCPGLHGNWYPHPASLKQVYIVIIIIITIKASSHNPSIKLQTLEPSKRTRVMSMYNNNNLLWWWSLQLSHK